MKYLLVVLFHFCPSLYVEYSLTLEHIGQNPGETDSRRLFCVDAHSHGCLCNPTAHCCFQTRMCEIFINVSDELRTENNVGVFMHPRFVSLLQRGVFLRNEVLSIYIYTDSSSFPISYFMMC